MKRRKPKEFTWLEQGGGRKVRGAGQVTVSGSRLFMVAGQEHKIPELVHRWMSKDKRQTHKRERREGKRLDL